MAQLNYNVLSKSGYNGFILREAPEKIMQFGEGNFLRAFADYFIDTANEKAGYNAKTVLVQPIASGLTDIINQQEGLYTLYLRGSEKGQKTDIKRVISSCSRAVNPYAPDGWQAVLNLAKSPELSIIISNTTEAGIVYDDSCSFSDIPPSSFPAKLTRALYERYASGRDGVVILSCELIDNNGKELLSCVNKYIDQWKLDKDFREWVNSKNIFCSTLVDRIVPGRIRDKNELEALNKANGYEDELIDVGEVFGVWIIEGPAELEDILPFKRAGLPVHVVPDVTPYKKRKVRILNGAHTGFVLGAYLAGYDIVRDCMHNDTIRAFMNKMIYDEIIPTLPLDKRDLIEFAEAVQDRFDNPFVNHELLSISLNSTSKWRARNMPSLLEYFEKEKLLPPCLVMSLAAYTAFYSNNIQELTDKGLICRREKNTYTVIDDRSVLEFYYARRDYGIESLVHDVLCNKDFWGQDLTCITGMEQRVNEYLRLIRTEGAESAFKSVIMN